MKNSCNSILYLHILQETYVGNKALTILSFLFSLGVVFILIVLSAVFYATEAAYLAASKAKLHTLEKQGYTKAGLVKKLKEKMEKVIGTLLICNNLVNILSSALATSILLQLAGESGVVYATIIMTILIVIFAEVVPKFYAMRRAESYAMGMAPVLKLLIRFLSPITGLFEFIARIVLRLFGVKIAPGHMLSGTVEELRGIIDMHGGDEEAIEERAMLHSILDLGNVNVEEIMVHRKDVKMINLDDTVEKIIAEIVASHHTRLPIWQGNPDNIVGTIHAKSFLKLVTEETLYNKSLSQDDILSFAKKPWFIPETTTLFEQLQAFRKRREHMALVVDEYGALQGIVTLEDIIEEIVGDIDDEYDPDKTGFWQSANGEVFAVGATTIRDLNRQYGWSLPDNEAATIAGLLMYETRSIPQIGQTFKIKNFRIKVLRRVRNQITLVKIIP